MLLPLFHLVKEETFVIERGDFVICPSLIHPTRLQKIVSPKPPIA